MVQLDILARFSNTFIHHKADRLIEEGSGEGGGGDEPAGRCLFALAYAAGAVGADPRGNLC